MYELESHGLMQKVFLRGCWKNSNIAPLYICFGLAKMFWKGKQLLAFYSSVSIPEPRHFFAAKRRTPSKEVKKRKRRREEKEVDK